jgi:glycosyltransferase involved in cell wall biosynthesis
LVLQHPTPLNSESRDLLFVGNLDYYPNRDAIQWLCSEVVPRLRSRVSNWRLVVAGSGTFRPLGLDEVVDLGPVPDLQPYYRNALAALVPIHAGGGTRIKALDAFAYARTVVATPFGMEGLPIQHGVQGFVAESADQFADQCALLLSRPALCLQAGLLAYEWLRDHASLVNFREQLA